MANFYAASFNSGSVTDGANANSTPNGVGTTTTGNTSWTGNWTLQTVTGSLVGTHPIWVVAKKEAGQSGTPSMVVTVTSSTQGLLFTSASTNVTATAFTAIQVGTMTASGSVGTLTMDITVTAAGGNPSTRTSIQVDAMYANITTGAATFQAAGVSACTSAVIGSVTAKHVAAGTSSATATTAGTTSAKLQASGAVAAVSAVSGDATVIQPEVQVRHYATASNTTGTYVAPSFSAYKDIVLNSTNLSGYTPQAGDLVIAYAISEYGYDPTSHSAPAFSTQSGSTGSWTDMGTSSPSGQVGRHMGRATVSSTGAVTVRCPVSSTASNNVMTAGAFVISGWTGTPSVTNEQDANGLTSLTISAESYVVYVGGDWDAVDPGSAATPAGGVNDISYFDGSNYSVFVEHWTGQAAGTRNYGPSAPSGTTWGHFGVVIEAATAVTLQASGTTPVASALTGEVSKIGAAGGGLAAYHAYNFDENTGTTSADYGTDGTAATVNEWTAPGYNSSTSAISSGANTAGGTVVIPADPDNWTLMCWVRTRNSSGYSSIVESPNSDLWFEMNGFSLEPYTSGVGYSLAGGTLSSNVWTHVALVGETGVGTRVVLNGTTADSDSAVHPLSAGTYQISGSSAQTGDMDVDEFYYVQEALSDSEIATYMATPPSAGGGNPSIFTANGTVAATSGVSGDATVTTGGGNAAAGSINIISGLSGAPVGVKQAAGTIDAVTTLSGSPINPNEAPWLTSTSGRALLDQYGNPYFANVYTLWNLVAYAGAYDETGVGTTTPASVFDAVCAELAANGFNGVKVLSVSSSNNGERGPFADGRTWDGVAPWGAGGIGDLNESYWSRVDDLVEACAVHGLTLWFVLTSGYTVASGGAFASLNTTNGATFGTAIGNRYKNYSNIVWLHGSDYFSGYDAAIGAIQSAIEATGDTHPLTMIWYKESSTTIDSENNAPGTPPSGWDFSFVYSYNAAAFEVRHAWTDTTKPLYHGDGYYYEDGSTNVQNVLQLMSDTRGWAVTSGSQGFWCGSEGTWAGDSVGQYNAIFTEEWSDNHITAFTAAWTGLEGWEGLEPDLTSTFVTSSRGTDTTPATPAGSGAAPEYNLADSQNNYLTAAFRADGTLAVLYTPTARTGITIDDSHLTASYTVKWMDPFNGAITAETVDTSYDTPGTNSEGFNGWFLVFEESSASTFGASGTIPATSAVSGAVTKTTPVSGTVAATSAVAGEVTADHVASGTIAASSATDGAVTAQRPAAGDVTLVTTVSGDVTALHVATGTITAVTTVAGDAGVSGVVAGEVTATTEVTGAVTALHVVSGTVAAVSTVEGDAYIPTSTDPASGTVAIISATAGAVTAQHVASGATDAVSTVVGTVTKTGAAAGTASAVSALSGAVTALHVVSGTTDAVTTISGNPSQVGFNQGTGAGTYSYSGAAAGDAAYEGAGTGSYTYTGAASSSSANAGSGTGSYAYSGSATGEITTSGTTTSTLQYTGSSSGTRTSSAAGTGAYSWSGSSIGQSGTGGSGSGSYSYATLTAEGSRESAGQSSGSYDYNGSGAGASPTEASGSGDRTYEGNSTGERTPKGVGTGSYSWSSSSTGLKDSSASGQGSYTWTGSATSSGVNAGVGSGSHSYIGTSSGKRVPKSTLTSTYQYVGSASGLTPSGATGSGVFTWAGSSSGIGDYSGSGTGVLDWSSVATAYRYRNVDVLGIFLRPKDRGFSTTPISRVVSVTMDNES